MKSRLKSNHWVLTRPSAHRGLHSRIIPENSIMAFEKAIEKNYPIELDLQMTKDGKIVCFHDDNLKRVTGLDSEIQETDYKTIKSLKLLNSEYAIPDFSEVLTTVNGRVPLLIEIKKQKYEGIAVRVVDELKGYNGEFAIQAFDPRILKAIKKLNTNIILGQLGTADKSDLGFITNFALKWLPFNRSVKPDFINYNLKNLPIGRLITNNLPLISWTVRNEQDKKTAKTHSLNYIFENIEP